MYRDHLGTGLFGGYGLRLDGAGLYVGGGLLGCFGRNGGLFFFGQWLYYRF